MENIQQRSFLGHYARKTTAVIPRDLAKKFGHKPIYILGMFYGGFQNPTREQWKDFEKLGICEKIKYSPEEIKELLCKKSPCLVAEFDQITIHICAWCKSQTYKIHAHHYPISKKNKGLETVNICTNCHTEFHYLSDLFHYRVKKEYEKSFLESYKEFFDHCDSFEEAQ